MEKKDIDTDIDTEIDILNFDVDNLTIGIGICIGIIGIGILGTAILETLKIFNVSVKCYDKYKNFESRIDNLLDCKFIFLCLPTPYISNAECKVEDKVEGNMEGYNKTELYNVISELDTYKYNGIIVIKSTIEPGTTEHISNLYPNLKIIHNPEFLTSRTATNDFLYQSHIVLGISRKEQHHENNYEIILRFYKRYFSDAKISICTSTESECMKIACNAFYSTKIQFFTEIKLLCDCLDTDYNNVKNLLLDNGWINPMHTNVPGHDGKLSFGGSCFPKDIQALNSFMKHLCAPNQVINAVVEENKKMRD